ncbi:hypothetical protein Trydic_g18544 [Trypoxylus dichotomus]
MISGNSWSAYIFLIANLNYLKFPLWLAILFTRNTFTLVPVSYTDITYIFIYAKHAIDFRYDNLLDW